MKTAVGFNSTAHVNPCLMSLWGTLRISPRLPLIPHSRETNINTSLNTNTLLYPHLLTIQNKAIFDIDKEPLLQEDLDRIYVLAIINKYDGEFGQIPSHTICGVD